MKAESVLLTVDTGQKPALKEDLGKRPSTPKLTEGNVDATECSDSETRKKAASTSKSDRSRTGDKTGTKSTPSTKKEKSESRTTRDKSLDHTESSYTIRRKSSADRDRHSMDEREHHSIR
ncbi:hypothetical protein Q1695_005894 [Nippostrongylus brasiliensis]|nr:hypothetical protein Q1695_005894 [Nippostrongylus brasiliensis]